MGDMTVHECSLVTDHSHWRFAHLETAYNSPARQEPAEFDAEETKILEWLGQLAPAERQPNLLFAVALHVLGGPANSDSLALLIDENGDDLSSEIA